MELRYVLAGLVLVSWVGNALYSWMLLKRAWHIPYMEEGEIAERFGRRGKNVEVGTLRQELPRLESIAPGFKYIALVPLAISASFALNGLLRVLWLKDGTASVWFGVALIFLPATITVFLFAYEQQLLITRLHELEHEASGVRLSDLKKEKEAAGRQEPPEEPTEMQG